MRTLLLRTITAALLTITANFVAAPITHAATIPGSLIKLSCPAGADTNHPCRAVYFYGSDNKRHAFPNAKVYATWYTDFSTVQTVTASALAALQLGENVTTRPGTRMIKFQTDPKTYAVGLGSTLHWIKDEATAIALYGTTWNTQIDDVSDAFVTNYRFGTDITTATDFNPATERAAAATIDDNLPSTHRSISVSTPSGTFSIEMIKLQKERFSMITDTGDAQDCNNNCTAKPLADYATQANAQAAIHGSYFCPPDYPECATKINTFHGPFFDTNNDTMVNAGDLPIHEGPMLTYSSDNLYRFFHRTKNFGNTIEHFEVANNTTLLAAASNFPSLIENGTIIVQNEARLDDNMRTQKSVRGGFGMNDKFIFLVIARSATVPDLATIMHTLGAKDALNLDGGGSAAMWYQGNYNFGPGRLLPTAIMFQQK